MWKSMILTILVAQVEDTATPSSPTISNGGFETDRTSESPGYVQSITGWSFEGAVGINPYWENPDIQQGPEMPFVDNGMISEGRQTALLQNRCVLRQRVDGFRKGIRYQVTCFVNARNQNTPETPRLEVRLGDETIVSPFYVRPVEEVGSHRLPFHHLESAPFSPQADGAYDLIFLTGDEERVTLLLDDVRVEAIDEKKEKQTVKLLRRAVAVIDVCAWPNLTRLPDGKITACIFNQPAHGSKPGDVDCWISEDNGHSWYLQGLPALRPEPTMNRMNISAGLNAFGNLVVISSGYPYPGEFSRGFLPTIVTRSPDGGKTWSQHMDFLKSPDGQEFIPFGDIYTGHDGRLRMSGYTIGESGGTWMLVGDPKGEVWGNPVQIDRGLNECAILHLGEGEWIAIARTAGNIELLRQYRSMDDGTTWTFEFEVSEQAQIPAHLLQLRNGNILLTYGDRRPDHYGVEARLSKDKGHTWELPLRIADLPQTDLGYPASVQLEEDTILTAYYAGKSDLYQGYAMLTTHYNL